MEHFSNASVLQGRTVPIKPNCIHRLFEDLAEDKHRTDVALIFDDITGVKTVTYGDLNKFTNKLARTIKATITQEKLLPNNDGDYIVVVSMLPSEKLIMTLLAIWKAGAAYLPIDAEDFPNSRVEHILNEAKPVLVIHEKGFHFTDRVVSKTFDDLLEESKYFSEDRVKEKEYLQNEKTNMAIVFYTSGSTGVPKGVRLPHEAIQNRLQWEFKTFPYSPSENVVVFKTSVTFVDCVREIWGPLLNGRSVLVIPKKVTQDPEKLIGMLHKYKIQRLILVPSLLRSLLLFSDLQKNDKLLDNLKIWVCASEPLPVNLAIEFFKRFPTNDHILCNFYGTTEVMGDVTYHVISSLNQLKDATKVPIGVPMDNSIIYLLDDNLEPVDIGTVGKLWVSGLNLAAGYVNGRNSESFIDNPYHCLYPHPQFGKLYNTGDYAKIDNGTILYEGRTDSQVKIRGHRLDLSEVEKAVTSLPVIANGVVLCYHSGDIDQRLLAFVTLKFECLLNELQIERMLQKELVSYMRPQVIILDSIPLLLNGKIDRQFLLKSYENRYKNDYLAAEIDIEISSIAQHQKTAAKILLETIASVVKCSTRCAIKIDSNFYDIGGNSLNSILTIAKLNEQGYYISIGDFIKAQDLREILNHISPEKYISPRKSETAEYTYDMLKHEHKEEVFKIVNDGLYEKGDLERWLKPDLHKSDLDDHLDNLWDALIEQDLSFIAKSESGVPVGVTLSLDARDEPEVEIHTKLAVILDFLEYAEGTIRDKILPPGKGRIFYNNIMATSMSLSPKENVSVIQYMEEVVLQIAKNKNFSGVLSSNTSPLTQQLGISIYGYQVMSDIQVNKYIASDGSTPFEDAPDSQRLIVCWKPF